MKKFLIVGSLIVIPLLVAGVAAAASLFPAKYIRDGNYTDWNTSYPVLDHYRLVQVDYSCGNATSTPGYLYTSTEGDRDSFRVDLSSLGSDKVITKIEISPCAKGLYDSYNFPELDFFYSWNDVNSFDAGDQLILTPFYYQYPLVSFDTFLPVEPDSRLDVGMVHDGGGTAYVDHLSTKITYVLVNASSSPDSVDIEREMKRY